MFDAKPLKSVARWAIQERLHERAKPRGKWPGRWQIQQFESGPGKGTCDMI